MFVYVPFTAMFECAFRVEKFKVYSADVILKTRSGCVRRFLLQQRWQTPWKKRDDDRSDDAVALLHTRRHGAVKRHSSQLLLFMVHV